MQKQIKYKQEVGVDGNKRFSSPFAFAQHSLISVEHVLIYQTAFELLC